MEKKIDRVSKKNLKKMEIYLNKIKSDVSRNEPEQGNTKVENNRGKS